MLVGVEGVGVDFQAVGGIPVTTVGAADELSVWFSTTGVGPRKSLVSATRAFNRPSLAFVGDNVNECDLSRLDSDVERPRGAICDPT